MNKHFVYRVYRNVEVLVHVIAADEDEAFDRAVRYAEAMPISEYQALDPYEIEYYDEGPIDDNGLFI